MCLISLLKQISGLTDGQANCPNGEDYSPCSCSGSSSSLTITCSLQPMETVRATFTKNSAYSTPLNIDLRPAPTDDTIPFDVISTDKYAGVLMIRCPSAGYQLKIDPLAFRYSRPYTTRLTITSCDLRFLNFAFLDQFANLTNLAIQSSSNVNFSLPTLTVALPSLTSLSLYSCQGLNDWTEFPRPLVAGLTTFDAGSSRLTDSIALRILNWVVASSNSTLTTLYMDTNELVQVPSRISSFRVLTYVDLSYNAIQVLRTGALSFTAPVDRLLLNGNDISYVQPDAFQGLGNFYKKINL